MKKILCKLFGHKYSKKWKENNHVFVYGNSICFRCGHNWMNDLKIYWSNP